MEYSVSTLKTNTIQAATGTTVSIASGQVLTQPGSVIQVLQNTSTAYVATTSDSFVDVGTEATAADTAAHFVDTLKDRIQRVRNTDQEIKEIVKKERKKRRVKIADSDLSEFME